MRLPPVRNFIIAFFVLAVLGVQIYVWVDSPKVKDADNAPPSPTPVQLTGTVKQVLSGVYVVENNLNVKDWEMWADSGDYSVETKNWLIKKVHTIFYATNKVTYDITANTGSIVNETKDSLRNVQLNGNVVTHSSNGYIFTSDQGLYDQKTKIITFPHAIEVQGPIEKDKTRLIITGDTMTLNLNNNEIIISGHVIGHKTVPGQGRSVLHADLAKLSTDKHVGRFIGHVNVNNGIMSLDGSEIEIVYLKQKLQNATLLNVTAKDPTKTVTAGKVFIDFQKDEYTFSDHPIGKTLDSEFSGDVIKFLQGGKKVEVQDAQATVGKKTEEELRKNHK